MREAPVLYHGMAFVDCDNHQAKRIKKLLALWALQLVDDLANFIRGHLQSYSYARAAKRS